MLTEIQTCLPHNCFYYFKKSGGIFSRIEGRSTQDPDSFMCMYCNQLLMQDTDGHTHLHQSPFGSPLDHKMGLKEREEKEEKETTE